jgi:hypothetical protein
MGQARQGEEGELLLLGAGQSLARPGSFAIQRGESRQGVQEENNCGGICICVSASRGHQWPMATFLFQISSVQFRGMRYGNFRLRATRNALFTYVPTTSSLADMATTNAFSQSRCLLGYHTAYYEYYILF